MLTQDGCFEMDAGNIMSQTFNPGGCCALTAADCTLKLYSDQCATLLLEAQVSEVIGLCITTLFRSFLKMTCQCPI